MTWQRYGINWQPDNPTLVELRILHEGGTTSTLVIVPEFEIADTTAGRVVEFGTVRKDGQYAEVEMSFSDALYEVDLTDPEIFWRVITGEEFLTKHLMSMVHFN